MSDAAARAREFTQNLGYPRRRAKPRIATALIDAEHRMVNGVAAWRLGEGPAVLMVHGWEDDNSLWSPLIDRLAMIGRAVVALDLPAHGFSEGERVPLLVAAKAVADVAAEMGPIDAVVGHSFGCPAIVTAIEDHAFAPKHVVLIGSALHQRGQIIRLAERNDIPDDVVEAIFATYEEDVGRPVDWFDLRRAAPAMTAKALILHSLDDDACDYRGAQELADVWPGAELALTDGLGHRLIAQDASVVERIVDFVA
ncbi:MAG: alpha/beta fold hydrolase [Alphaproteobacteria bacterium]|nr:alpha/beta fold hydrolase [Alphaproteobacteria bacterium]